VPWGGERIDDASLKTRGRYIHKNSAAVKCWIQKFGDFRAIRRVGRNVWEDGVSMGVTGRGGNFV